MRVCIVGASGKLGQYMVQHALDRRYEVVGVCREQSVGKLDKFKGRITVVPGATNDPDVIRRAIAGCDGVLVVLVPRGVHEYSTGTAQAVLDQGIHLWKMADNKTRLALTLLGPLNALLLILLANMEVFDAIPQRERVAHRIHDVCAPRAVTRLALHVLQKSDVGHRRSARLRSLDTRAGL